MTYSRCAFRMRSAILLLAVVVAGCRTPLRTEYAAPRSPSINGVSAFVALLKSTGRRVDVWPVVSPRMSHQYDALIVFHSAFGPTSKEFKEEIRELLSNGSAESLILVLRDSDAAVDYWDWVSQNGSVSEQDRAAAKQAKNLVDTELRSEAMQDVTLADDDWYGLQHVFRANFEMPLHVRLNSETDAEPREIAARWPLQRRMEVPDDSDVRWVAGDDPLLVHHDWHGTSVYVLASAAPLLNGGLVDPGNRQLAEALIELLPPDSRVAVSVTSTWSSGEQSDSPSLWRLLRVHPYPWIFGQAVLAMLIFCWWKLPIFGRPRTTESVETLRFGRHVDALGRLLARTHDVTFAKLRIRDWQRGGGPSSLILQDSETSAESSPESVTGDISDRRQTK